MGVFVDTAGDIFIADSGKTTPSAKSWPGRLWVKMIAGSSVGTPGFTGDGGAATSATLHNPQGVALDSLSDIFIAAPRQERYSRGSRVRQFDRSGPMQVLTGVPGVTGEGGLATGRVLQRPVRCIRNTQTTISSFADTGNSIIREVTVVDKKIHAVAGNGTSGFGGDEAYATQAQLSFPRGVFVDSSGTFSFP